MPLAQTRHGQLPARFVGIKDQVQLFLRRHLAIEPDQDLVRLWTCIGDGHALIILPRPPPSTYTQLSYRSAGRIRSTHKTLDGSSNFAPVLGPPTSMPWSLTCLPDAFS